MRPDIGPLSEVAGCRAFPDFGRLDRDWVCPRKADAELTDGRGVPAFELDLGDVP